jgi:hypothetical protein
MWTSINVRARSVQEDAPGGPTVAHVGVLGVEVVRALISAFPATQQGGAR